jgi:hypothetical protein
MVKTFRKRRTKRGFSLAETMVAIGVGSLTLTGTLAMLSLQWKLIRRNNEHHYVGHVLESRLEELRDLTFDEVLDLPTEIDFEPLPVVSVYGKTANGDLGIYEGAGEEGEAPEQSPYVLMLRDGAGRVNIESLSADLVKVTAQISWKAGYSEETTEVSSVTFITRDGIGRK